MFLLGLVLLFQADFAKEVGKVSVELEASWNSGPLFLEAAEFIHSLQDGNGAQI